MYDKPITFDRFVRWLGYGGCVLGTIWLINYLSEVLLPFAIAWLLAYLLYPIVKFVQYRLHVPGRALSIIVTLVGVLGVATLFTWFIVPPMLEQFKLLGDLVTSYIQSSAYLDNIPQSINRWTEEHRNMLQDFIYSDKFSDNIKEIVSRLMSVLGQTANLIVNIAASLIMLLYMFFILLDYEYLTENWIKIFPKKNRPFWRSLASDAETALSKYIRGQSLVALIMGILFCIGFTIIDFPMAIGLGILIGILDLVPYLHTFALIPTVLLALLKAANTGQNFWIILLMALAVFVIVQAICDMIVTPKVMGRAMGLNPAILLLSLSVWGTLLGFIGLIVALPLTTLLMAYYKRYVTHEDDEIDEKSAANEKTS